MSKKKTIEVAKLIEDAKKIKPVINLIDIKNGTNFLKEFDDLIKRIIGECYFWD